MEIITLCGSLKFQKEMMTVAEKMALDRKENWLINIPLYNKDGLIKKYI